MIKKTLDLSRFDLKENYRKKDDAFDALGIAICAAMKAYWWVKNLCGKMGVDNGLWKNIIDINSKIINFSNK